jgi:predicted Zn-dependent protease
LLWHISQRFPKEGWVLKELERFYHRTRNTRGLNKVYAAMLDYDDKNLYAKNNFAAISLLLKLNLDKAHAMAKESFDQRPKDPVTVSTYAYSLHLQGKTAQGIKTMDALTAKQLEKPGIAAYYGLMLAANGDGSKARKYLDIASRAPLLSEEKAFVQEALKGI